MNAISSIQAVQPPLPTPSQPASGIPVAAVPADKYKPIYYSPALTIDPTTGTDVIQIRDSSTGAVTAQYPSEKDLKAYQAQTQRTTDTAKADAVPTHAPADHQAQAEAPKAIEAQAVPADIKPVIAQPVAVVVQVSAPAAGGSPAAKPQASIIA